MKNKDEN